MKPKQQRRTYADSHSAPRRPQSTRRQTPVLQHAFLQAAVPVADADAPLVQRLLAALLRVLPR
jgi:hypothetical protein